MRSRLRPAIAFLAAGLALRIMLGLAATAPALPDPHRSEAWTWLQTTHPTTAAAAVLALIVRVLATYLAAGLGLEALARLTNLRSLRRAADRAAGPLVRHLVAVTMSSTVVMGAGLAAVLPPAPVAAATAEAVDQPPDDVAVMRRLEHAEQPDKHAASTTSTTVEPSTTSTTTEAHVTTTTAIPATSTTSTSAAPVAAPGGAIVTVPSTPRTDSTPPATSAAPARSGEHVVRRGEHFWSIAEGQISAQLGRAATDDEIDGYWRRLIEANRDRLVVPGDPDVLMPGQALRVPAA